MSRREVRIRKKCHYPECERTANWLFDSNAAYLRSHEFNHYERDKNPYYCAKHACGIGVLSRGNTRAYWTSEPSKANGQFRGFGSQGIIFGPGFCAEACDFPIGTRIEVTAEAILPPPEEPQS